MQRARRRRVRARVWTPAAGSGRRRRGPRQTSARGSWRRSSAKTDEPAAKNEYGSTAAVGGSGVDAPDADVEALLGRVLTSVAPSEWLRARRLVPRLQLATAEATTSSSTRRRRS